MVEIPPLDGTISRIYDGYVERSRVAPPRTHMGASEIGRECDRQIWYSFRWVTKSQFDGRMLRLFDTGKLEENRLVTDLQSIGVDVRPFDLKTGKQYRMELFGGHFGGSLDGICINLPEAPKSWHVLEMKTHNDKSFKALLKDGVQGAKPEHYAQMQVYMGMSHEQIVETVPVCDRALYFAVNKNTDELYIERVKYNAADYLLLREKAERITFLANPPARISNKPDFFKCRFCNYNALCHGKATQFVKPLRNCRTCIHATPTAEGKWRCEKWNRILAPIEQDAGCEKHLYIPNLFPLKQSDATENSVVYDDGMGNTITNFEGGELVMIRGDKDGTRQISKEQPKQLEAFRPFSGEGSTD